MSCHSEHIEVDMAEMVDVTVSTSFPVTRSGATAPPGYHFRYALQVLVSGTSETFYSQVQTSPVFEMRLPKNLSFDFYAWVDIVESGTTNLHYNIYTGGKLRLDEISILLTNVYGSYEPVTSQYGGISHYYADNANTRDAFYGKAMNKTSAQAQNLEIEVYRPFARINIYATDAAYVKKLNERDLPDFLGCRYHAYPSPDENRAVWYQQFNAFTGVTGGDSYMLSHAHVNGDDPAEPLLTDYIFITAPEGIEQRIRFSIEFWATQYEDGGNTIYENRLIKEVNFENIPVKRNHVTNVYGRLLTEDGEIEVVISADFDNSNIINIY